MNGNSLWSSALERIPPVCAIKTLQKNQDQTNQQQVNTDNEGSLNIISIAIFARYE
jgi:hypothetical protein